MGYICIHGHFYQPPRENPWLEAIELQESAHPYHDWNERIHAECYERNAASRILDEEHHIVRIVSNYSKMSFNFGPTLLQWMEVKHPGVYRSILNADAESERRFSGHGSALAQAYNHMIMPLANERDKYTQARWGIQDFEHRFGRKPEGMWLPETAVDLPTLEILAGLGIKFTILAPGQASRVRKIGGHIWKNVEGGRIDPTMVYLLRLPSGNKINLFFYDEPIARAVAFEGLLKNGEQFAKRLGEAFSEETRPWPELVHVATDGETFGHHHRYGEMALCYALDYIESKQLAEITNYGEYLERHPPTHVVEIIENTSWSCAHGVERWRANCGCNSGGHPGWSQEWRRPLREALDWLRDKVAPGFEAKAGAFLKDPWAARDDYIGVILDRSENSLAQFLQKHAARPLRQDEKVAALKLLEMQRHAMLMYTSCGWFFDELSGIETVQVVQYAGRVVQLAEEVLGEELETPFLEMLAQAKSNVPELRDGALIYQKFVKPAFVNLPKVALHYAIRSLFEPYEAKARIYCYNVEREEGLSLAGDGKEQKRLSVGRALFTSAVTHESEMLTYAALDDGNLNPLARVRLWRGEEASEALIKNLERAFSLQKWSEVVQLVESSFEGESYNLTTLFKDEQRVILSRVIESEWAEAEASFDSLYPHLISVLRTLARLGAPPIFPRAFHAAAEFAMNTKLRRAMESDAMDLQLIRDLAADAEGAKIQLDVTTLEYTLRMKLQRLAEALQAHPSDLNRLQQLDATAALAASLPLDVNFWRIQNVAYGLLQTTYGDFLKRAQQGDQDAIAWVERFKALAESLLIRVA
jgi:alpha-amylase/alpha-mannosidase (GH57 family)